MLLIVVIILAIFCTNDKIYKLLKQYKRQCYRAGRYAEVEVGRFFYRKIGPLYRYV